MDMAGNVWEWTTGCRNATGGACPQRAIRGGSYRWGVHEARAVNRAWLPPFTRSDETGFRCVYVK